MDLDKLFNISAERRFIMPTEVRVPLGIDTHVHGRNGVRSRMVINMCVGEFEAILDVANEPNVNSLETYKSRVDDLQALVPQSQELQIYTCPLICDTTDPAMLIRAWRRGLIAGVKIFWEGVSNAYGQFITSSEAIRSLVRALPEGFVVTLHAECAKNTYTGEYLTIENREYWCVVNQVEKMMRWNKGIVYIIRHVSDERTLQWVEEMQRRGYRVFAELSPQYAIQIDDSIFIGDDDHAVLNCDCIYWPRPKKANSRRALQKILLRCPAWLIYGSDLAVHLHDPTQMQGVKINANGKAVGGLTLLPAAAKSILIDFCVANGKPEVLRKLLVENPSAAYGIKLKGTEATYVRKDWKVEEFTHDTESRARSINFLRNHTMRWQRAS